MDFDMRAIYEGRRRKVAEYMSTHDIAAAVFEDTEARRDVSVRYLTGQPSDAALVLTAGGCSVLVAWDVNLARMKAHADQVLSSEDFERDYTKATVSILHDAGCPKGAIVSVHADSPFSRVAKWQSTLDEWNVRADEEGVHSYVQTLRACKDDYEISCIKQAAAITDEMSEAILEEVRRGKTMSEADVALFAERELRLRGAERTSFDTLAAGSTRSFAIHAFPGYTAGSWGSEGLSLLDYGVCFEGYASDCTIAVARSPSRDQMRLVELVQQAASECVLLYKAGGKIKEAVRRADDIFAAAGRAMPHGLGHGIGLEIHEEPFVSLRASEEQVFEVGNVVTLEPGLYDATLGGVRLENDVLITPEGPQVLTHSRILRL